VRIGDFAGHFDKKTFDFQFDVAIRNHGLGNGLLIRDPLQSTIDLGGTREDPTRDSLALAPRQQISRDGQIALGQFALACSGIAAREVQNHIGCGPVPDRLPKIGDEASLGAGPPRHSGDLPAGLSCLLYDLLTDESAGSRDQCMHGYLVLLKWSKLTVMWSSH